MSAQDHTIFVAKALHSILSESLAVQSVLGAPPRLYDNAPEDPVYPYLSYGAMRSEDIGGDIRPLYAHNLSLHIWSHYSGRAEIINAIAAVSGALEGIIYTSGSAQIRSVRVVYSDHFRGPNGRTLHGLIRLNIITEPTE